MSSAFSCAAFERTGSIVSPSRRFCERSVLARSTKTAATTEAYCCERMMTTSSDDARNIEMTRNAAAATVVPPRSSNSRLVLREILGVLPDGRLAMYILSHIWGLGETWFAKVGPWHMENRKRRGPLRGPRLLNLLVIVS